MKKIVQTGNIRSGSQIKHFISGGNVSKHIYFAARETVAKPMPGYDAILFCSLLRRFSLLRINHFILNSIIMLRNYLSFSSMRMDSAQPKTAIVKPDWAQSGAGTKKTADRRFYRSRVKIRRSAVLMNFTPSARHRIHVAAR